jgi:hypothetical protein
VRRIVRGHGSSPCARCVTTRNTIPSTAPPRAFRGDARGGPLHLAPGNRSIDGSFPRPRHPGGWSRPLVHELSTRATISGSPCLLARHPRSRGGARAMGSPPRHEDEGCIHGTMPALDARTAGSPVARACLPPYDSTVGRSHGAPDSDRPESVASGQSLLARERLATPGLHSASAALRLWFGVVGRRRASRRLSATSALPPAVTGAASRRVFPLSARCLATPAPLSGRLLHRHSPGAGHEARSPTPHARAPTEVRALGPKPESVLGWCRWLSTPRSTAAAPKSRSR